MTLVFPFEEITLCNASPKLADLTASQSFLPKHSRAIFHILTLFQHFSAKREKVRPTLRQVGATQKALVGAAAQT